MSKKQGGDLVFNEDFDQGSEERPPAPPPARPIAPPPAQPAASPPAQSAQPAIQPPPPVEVPHVEDTAVVPAVPAAPAPSQGETSEVILDFTASTAAPVTTGDIQPATDDPEAQLTPTPQEPQQPEKRSWFSVKPFQKYFDVDDKEVGLRLLNSAAGPFRASFHNNTVGNPDLWGPFWIATTLIFLTVVSSNLKSYTKHRNSEQRHEDWDGDYGVIGLASLVYYVYLFGAGLLLYFILRCGDSSMKLVHIWCIYGYSWTIMIPALMAICLVHRIPDSGWSKVLFHVVAILASLYSAGFLVRNFSWAGDGMGRMFALLAGMFLVHMLPGLLIIFLFH